MKKGKSSPYTPWKKKRFVLITQSLWLQGAQTYHGSDTRRKAQQRKVIVYISTPSQKETAGWYGISTWPERSNITTLCSMNIGLHNYTPSAKEHILTGSSGHLLIAIISWSKKFSPGKEHFGNIVYCPPFIILQITSLKQEIMLFQREYQTSWDRYLISWQPYRQKNKQRSQKILCCLIFPYHLHLHHQYHIPTTSTTASIARAATTKKHLYPNKGNEISISHQDFKRQSPWQQCYSQIACYGGLIGSWLI